jgi:hypothetical protein
MRSLARRNGDGGYQWHKETVMAEQQSSTDPQPLYCRTCGKARGKKARGEGQCRACAARLSGKKFGAPIAYETVKDKKRRVPTDSWWTKPRPDFTAAAQRMAGGGWTE